MPAEPDWQVGVIDEKEVFHLLEEVDVEWDAGALVLRWRLEEPDRTVGYVLLFQASSCEHSASVSFLGVNPQGAPAST